MIFWREVRGIRDSKSSCNYAIDGCNNVLINFYIDINVSVSWLGRDSDCFIARNGVKQGCVLRPIFFCIYVDDLLQQLAKARVGCFVDDHFAGAFAYADDIVLIARSPSAMHTILSKCIIVRPRNKQYFTLRHYRNVHMTPFKINDEEIEFVDRYKYNYRQKLNSLN